MAATRAEKKEIIDSIEEQLAEAPVIYLTDFSGLTVKQTNELRGRFREAGVSYRVTKNTLLRMAMDELDGYDEVVERVVGPTAVAFTDDPAAPAKVIENFTEEYDTEKPAFKGAVVEEDFYDADEFDTLVSMKSREELVSEIIGLLQSPARTLVGALQSPGGRVAGAIKGIAEQAEEDE